MVSDKDSFMWSPEAAAMVVKELRQNDAVTYSSVQRCNGVQANFHMVKAFPCLPTFTLCGGKRGELLHVPGTDGTLPCPSLDFETAVSPEMPR